jgi:hypothetical protein
MHGEKRREKPTRCEFRLEKTNPKLRLFAPMLRFLANLCHRPAIRFGLARDRRGSRLRDPRFVSFMAQTNRRSLDTDLKDTLLRGRKLVRHAVVSAAIAGAAWFALESAQALSIF